MYAGQVDQRFNLRPNFELQKWRHYSIIPTGTRYNMRPLAAGDNSGDNGSRFTGLLFTLCLSLRKC